MINLVGGILLLTVTCLSGLVAYGRYYDCDLLGSKKIDKGEQVKFIEKYLRIKIIKIIFQKAIAVSSNGHFRSSSRFARSFRGHYL